MSESPRGIESIWYFPSFSQQMDRTKATIAIKRALQKLLPWPLKTIAVAQNTVTVLRESTEAST